MRKHALLRLAVCLYLCSLGYVAFAAGPFYVDFDSGSDSNSGTATNAAWRTLPGTLTTDDTSLLGNWGTYNSNTNIPAGSVIYLKLGTTYDKTDPGGSCYIQGTGGSKDVYTSSGAGFGAGVTITTTNWGTGVVTIDGAGKTNGLAMWLVGMSGVTIDGGNGGTNIVFKNASGDGLQVKEQHGTGLVNDYFWIQYVKGLHCGTQLTNDLAGAGSGHFNIRYVNHLKVNNNEVDGASDTNYINGWLFGDNGKFVKDALVRDTSAHHLKGDTGPNDSGIGFKALNSQIVFTNVLSQFNLKGMDIGEQSGAGGYDITAEIYNSTFHSNAVSGVGLTGKAAFYNGQISNWIYNCHIFSNNNFGINCYSTPQNTFIVQNEFGYNGDTALSGAYAGNIRANPNSSSDTNTMRVTILNNIFVAPADCQLCSTDYSTPSGATGTDYTQFSDWNIYVQRSSELFAQWAYFNGSEFLNVSYAQGPANATGQWATNYSNTGTAPIRGTGHFGSDKNSTAILSGASEASNFWKVGYPTWSINTNRIGTNFSAQSWFAAGMGYDRLGVARTKYYIGAYEVPSTNSIGHIRPFRF